VPLPRRPSRDSLFEGPLLFLYARVQTLSSSAHAENQHTQQANESSLAKVCFSARPSGRANFLCVHSRESGRRSICRCCFLSSRVISETAGTLIVINASSAELNFLSRYVVCVVKHLCSLSARKMRPQHVLRVKGE
jgi:hypothetical protein